MSEWLDFVKAYATKHNISYKQALRDASPHIKQEMKRNPKNPLKNQNAQIKKKWLKILL